MVKLKDIVENVQIGKVYTDKDRPPFKAEGTCGYGIGGKLGEEPAGPHLLKKKKKDVNEKVDTEMKKIYQLLIKYGNNAKDAAAMIKKNLKYVNKTYRNSTPRGKAIALVGLSSIGESVDFKKAHKKFKETGELPPHLKKLVKDLDKVKVKHKVKNIVVPGLEWMSKIKEAVNEQQKRQASDIRNKFDQAYLKFSREVRDVIKMMDRSTGSKVDGKIIDKAYSKGLIPLDKLMKSWDRGQQSNPKIDEKVNEDVQDLKKVVKELENASKMHLAQSKRIQSHLDDMNVDEKVIKVSKKDDVPGNAMKMSGEEKIKKLTYSGSNGKGSYEIKGKNLNVIGIRPRDKGFFVRHFTMKTGFRKANLYYDGVNFMDKNKKF